MINLNHVQGLSWRDWVRIPQNKLLFEQNPARAKARYMEEEAELVETFMLQERMRVETIERQNLLSEQLRSITTDNVNMLSPTAGGSSEAAVSVGIGSSAVGTYLKAGCNGNGATAGCQNSSSVDGGFERFTVGVWGQDYQTA
tara:strand:+ start:8926 stop:9354 length:429 start_codon:yes stop_codon:yes gene_type:complete